MTTALAPRPAQVPEWAGPKESALIEQFPQAKYNLLVPTVSIRQVNPYLVPDIEVVQLSSDPADGDIYRDSQMKEGHYAPTAKGLARLASVAGITQLDSRRMDDGKDPDIVEWRSEIEMTLPSGRSVRGFGSKRIDLHTLTKGWTPARIAKMREHLVAMAETKAFNRAIRSLLSLHGSMPQAALARPFAVLRWIPDMSHPDVRKVFLQQLAPATAQVFGPATTNGHRADEPLLIEQQAPEDDAAPDEPINVTPDGEVVEEPDFSKPAKAAAEPTAGEQFVIVLRERAEASETKGAATQQQRSQLTAALRGLGMPTVMAVLHAAWELKEPGDITGAQADAILDHAEGRKDFQEQWKAAAAELATEAASA